MSNYDLNDKDFLLKALQTADIEKKDLNVYIAALLNKALQEKCNTKLTLVGGSVIMFLSQGHYTTADIDIVAENPRRVRELLHFYGFESVPHSKNRFVHPKLKIILDYFWGDIGEIRTDKIKIKDLEVEAESIEDLLTEKLKYATLYNDSRSEGQVRIIAELLQDYLDEEYLKKRLIKENLWDEWIRIRETGK